MEVDGGQLASEVEACAREISDYLVPHSNWGEPILPHLPGCPNVVFSSDEWNNTETGWLCLDAPAKFDSALGYTLEMIGSFVTTTGEDLTSSCRLTYTEDFLAATVSQVLQVNQLMGSTLCSGINITISGSVATLTADGAEVSTCT